MKDNLHTLKTFTCNTKYSLFSEEWVYWQSIECKDRQIANLEKRCQELVAHAILDEEQIANLTASRDRWKELAVSHLDC